MKNKYYPRIILALLAAVMIYSPAIAQHKMHMPFTESDEVNVVDVYDDENYSNSMNDGMWMKLNGPVGAVVSSLTTKGDTIIAGTGFFKAMVFYSTNDGATWQKNLKKTGRINDLVFLNDTSIVASAGVNGILKTDNLNEWNTIYNFGDFWSVGRDYGGNIYAGNDNGDIVHSSDGGKHWAILINGSGQRVNKFIISMDSVIYAGSRQKLYKKENINSIWSVIPITFTNQYYKPFTDNFNNLYAHSSGRIFKSTNRGMTWSQLDANLFFNGNYINDIIYNQNMIAGCEDVTYLDGTGYGIAISNDSGITWAWNNDGLPPKFSNGFKLSKSGTNTFLGTNAAGVFKSTNFGDSWFPINNGLTAADVLDICFDNAGTLYSASWSNGFQKSTDKGNTWIVINNGLTNSYCYSIIADSNGSLIGGTDQGIFRSTDKGETWVQTTSAGNNFAYRLYRDNQNRVYSLNFDGGIFRTSNLGNNWERIDVNFASAGVFGFAIDSSNNLYAGTRGGWIYKSTDDGNSWITARSGSGGYTTIGGITIAPNGYIFAANLEEGLLRSSDDGNTWQLKNNGITNLSLNTVESNRHGDLFISTFGNILYYSSDNGESWTNVSNNMHLVEVRNIRFDEQDYAYLATDESVWRSENPIPVELTAFTASVKENDVYLNWSTGTEVNNRGFELWRAAETTSPRPSPWQGEGVTLLGFVEGNGTTTEPKQYSFVDEDVASGKYKYKLVQIDYDGTRSEEKIIELEVNAAPRQFALYQNYPNPFNPSTMIKYSVPSAVNSQWSIVNLKVYDVLGNEVAVLVNETKQPGDYEVTFDASRFSSGVYLYKLTSGSFTAVKKMTVIK